MQKPWYICQADTRRNADRPCKLFINKYYNDEYSINSEKDGSPNL
jgi:hypothetical protein